MDIPNSDRWLTEPEEEEIRCEECHEFCPTDELYPSYVGQVCVDCLEELEEG